MRARGLTLIEISIALAIAALLVSISVPAISSITRAQLRQKSGQLSGGIRALYRQSASAGKSCRLALDLDKSEYQAECARGAVRLSGEPEPSPHRTRDPSRDEGLPAPAKAGPSAPPAA